MFKALQDKYFVVCDVCGATIASSEYSEELPHRYGYTHICDDCKETILWMKKKKAHLEG